MKNPGLGLGPRRDKREGKQDTPPNPKNILGHPREHTQDMGTRVTLGGGVKCEESAETKDRRPIL